MSNSPQDRRGSGPERLAPALPRSLIHCLGRSFSVRIVSTEAPPETPAQFSVAITDFKMNDDGTMTVYGPVTTESIDAVNDIVDADWAAKALDEWLNGKNFGNVRGQHQESWPVGRGLAVDRVGTTHNLKALIVDPLAQKLIQHRILKAFSIGIVGTKRTWDTIKSAWRVIGGRLDEVTVCDVPCNADTEFVLVKANQEGAAKSLDLFSRIDPKTLGSVLTPDEVITLANKFHLDTSHPGVAEAIAAHSLKADSCGTCDGSGKIRSGHVDCPDCQSGKCLEVKAGDEEVEWNWCAACDGGFDDIKVANDPSVGGGVDRDKVPAEDFAGPNRSFPIVEPGDVSDAASSLGRAGGADMSDAEKEALRARIKTKIIAIAKRKGAKFVAALPDAWKENDSQKAGKVTDEIEDDKALTEVEVVAEDEKAAPVADDGEKDGEDDHEDGCDCEKCGASKAADELPEDVTKSIDGAIERLHTATCATYTTEAVEKMDPGTWAERLDISALEDKLREQPVADGVTKAWSQLTATVGALAGPVIITRHVGEDTLTEAHNQMVAEQRAQKAATIQDAIGSTPGTQGASGGRPLAEGASARTFYTNQASARHAEQLKSIHDAVVGLRPDVCPLPGPPLSASPISPVAPYNTAGSGSVAGNDVNGGVTAKTHLYTVGDGGRELVIDSKTAVPVLDAGVVAAEDQLAVPVAPAEAPAPKAEVDLNAVVKEMGELISQRHEVAIAELKAAHEAQTKTLQDQINALQSQPNPMEAPLRKALLKFAPERTVVDASEQDERVAVLRRMAGDSSNPERQQDAQKALFNLETKGTTTPNE